MPFDDDPGWKHALRTGWPMLLPVMVPIAGRYLLRRRLRRTDRPRPAVLELLRATYASFVAGLGLAGVVVLLAVSPGARGGQDQFALGLGLGIAVVGAALLASSGRIERPLDCSLLAGSYRARFFLRVALSEVTATFGFAGSFVTGRWWVYFLAAGVTAIGFVRLAPTRAHLVADQVALDGAGCDASLLAALLVRPGG